MFDFSIKPFHSLRLIEPYEQFIVLEAKLDSKLSGGTTRAPEYNQVARNIACITGVLESSCCSIEKFQTLGFYFWPRKIKYKKKHFLKSTRKKNRCTKKSGSGWKLTGSDLIMKIKGSGLKIFLSLCLIKWMFP